MLKFCINNSVQIVFSPQEQKLACAPTMLTFVLGQDPFNKTFYNFTQDRNQI